MHYNDDCPRLDGKGIVSSCTIVHVHLVVHMVGSAGDLFGTTVPTGEDSTVVDHWLAIVGVALGVVATVMAAPPLFQMLFGRTRLVFEADDFTGPEGRILVIAIKNPPVANRFLRFIGIEREASDVTAFFDIQELGTQRIVVRSVTGQMHTTNLRQIGLQGRSMPGFTVGLTVIGTRNGEASIISAHPAEAMPIQPGHYIAHIAVVRGQDTYRIDQNFRVSTIDHETGWYERNVVSTRR